MFDHDLSRTSTTPTSDPSIDNHVIGQCSQQCTELQNWSLAIYAKEPFNNLFLFIY